MLITSSWKIDLIILFVVSIFMLYKYSTRKFNYWKKRGVYHPKPIPFLGNIADVTFFRTNIGEWLKKIYDSTDEPFFGIFVFDEPHLIIKSPELIKQIMVKDFHNFNDRTVAQPEHNKMIQNLMFFQRNPEWKEARSKITPVFTSGKLKSMFTLIEPIGANLLSYLEKNEGELESKEVCAKFATDVIAKCFFGINAHCFDDDEAMFRKLGRTVFDFSWRNGIVQTAYFFRQKWVDTFKLDFVEKWVFDYFHEAFSKTMRARQESGAKNNDLVDILNAMKKNSEFGSDMADLETEKLVGPAIQFFMAGFETTSSTISFTLYELCLNKNIQNKLRTEVLSNIKKHGGVTYEGLLEMKYMDLCVKEILRMYPVLPFLDRTCKEDYQLPGTNLVIEKGMPVFISMFGMHQDEKYFPDPKKFDPDRFQNKNYNSEGFVYFPFGEGPRACIGERFGLMSTKAALAYIIEKYEVEKCATTPTPVVFAPKSLVLQSTVGLPMRFKRIIPTPA
ncbi:unnamed protein product [Phaedon cochleariae]|uniref:Cytochrome P450 n=1 Tax=Phaedon cochleariae TaxID=80249 RepID=A0A9P0GNY8_PHACE|nr:unnamed protein product [Phaedon cochleariae]